MSDSDDTDDLLLIPPDFFVVHSDVEDSVKPYGPYYQVVDSLITQVNKLEDRINFIETASDVSFLSNSDYIGDSYNNATSLMSGVRKFSSWEDIPKPDEVYTGSTHSTPQKPRARIKLHSLPSTPSTDRYIPLRSRLNSVTSTTQYGQGDRQYIPQPSNNSKHSLQGSIFNVGVRHDEPGQVQKAQSKMLNEIDNFISNVKTIQKYNAARNLNAEFDTCNLHENAATVQNESGNSASMTKSGLNLNDVDQMLHAMESQQKEIESRLKEKEHELSANRENIETNEHYSKEKLWQQGDNKSSVPDRGMGMRDVLYDEQYRNNEHYKPPVKENFIKRSAATGLSSQEPSATDLSARNSESIYSDNSLSLSSSDSTQLTAYQNKISQDIGRNIINVNSDSEKIHTNAMHILNMHKDLLSRTSTSNPSIESGSQNRRKMQNFEKPNIYSFQNDLLENKSSDYEPSARNTLALLSLSELWNQTAAINDVRTQDHSKFLNKLQEEKLRRQHCEQLIQQLQTRTLELQERLAVAVQVDQAKDDAILRVHKSWEEAASKIDSLNNEKSLLEQQVTELKARTSFELSEATKKANHYENELSKALNLAHNNQEKLITVEKQNNYLTVEIQAFQIKLKTVQDNYNTQVDNNQQLSKLLSQKEIDLNENKNILSEARKEVAQSRRAVEICQAELSALKNSQTQVERELNNAVEHVKALEMDKSTFLADVETHKRIEKTLQDDLNKQKDVNEQNKVELRNFYQDQVEIVVRDKLREFQSQLEKAESSLQDEIRSRELSVAKAAAVHIQQVTEKHSLEVHLLEEKHKEEVKLYKLQLSQAQQQIENLQIKVQQQQERRSNIAQQLHKVMEAHWLEALKILNIGKSPVISQDKGTNTIDQLNSLKSRSYNNLEEILFKDDTQGNKAYGFPKVLKSKVPLFQSVESMSSIIDDDSYNRIVLPIHQISSETPVTSRPQKNRQQMENELQKYIQMLLSKSPGNPTDEQNSKYSEKYKNLLPDDHLDSGQQDHTDKLNPDGTKSNKVFGRDRLGKPPWK